MVIFESASGAVVLRESTKRRPEAQLTDDVIWLDGKGRGLPSGEVLWQRRGPATRTATPTHFLGQIICEDTAIDVCSAEVIPVTGPAKARHVDMVASRDHGKTLAPGGWIPQLTSAASANAPEGKNVPMQAFSLETGETVPLGNFRAVRSFSATQIVLERSDGTQAIFDPASKTLRESRVPMRRFLPFKQQWPTQDAAAVSWDEGKFPSSRALVVHRESGDLRIPVEQTAGVAHRDMQPDATLLWTAPGCIIAQGYSIPYTRAGVEDGIQTYLACIR